MIKVLIIVVTRFGPPDEFVQNWNTPKKCNNSDANYIPLNINNSEAGLLLVHGRSGMDANDCRNIIATAIKCIVNQSPQPDSTHLETLNDFLSRIMAGKCSLGKPTYLPVVFIHSPNAAACIKDLEDIGCISSQYSLGGHEPGFVSTLKETLIRATNKNRLTTKNAQELIHLVTKELDPSLLRIKYIHEIQELLLAIYFDAAVMANNSATSAQIERSTAELQMAFKEILENVRSTTFQELKKALDDITPPTAIYMIADVDEPGVLTYLGDFGKCKDFWRQLTSQGGARKIETPNTQDLASDIQKISESLQTLLARVGTKEGVAE